MGHQVSWGAGKQSELGQFHTHHQISGDASVQGDVLWNQGKICTLINDANDMCKEELQLCRQQHNDILNVLKALTGQI